MLHGMVSLASRVLVIVLAVLFCPSIPAQELQNPDQLLAEAERLAWIKAWTRAEPLYAEAARLYAARGDRRNALFAEINRLRGELPRLPVPEVSQRLAEFLDDPIVQTDDRVRLRCLVIKGETDEDLDPALAEESWHEALEIAERIGEPRWANRARGELGFVAFMMGDITSGVIAVTQAMEVARQNGDTPSLVRWLTLFGLGFIEVGRPQQALDFFDQALAAAESIPELRSPVMTYAAKADALVKLERYAEAETMLDEAFDAASSVGALGYQAQLTLRRAEMVGEQGDTGEALRLLDEAASFASQAGGDRILAEVSLTLSRLNVTLNRPQAADAVLVDGIAAARKVGGHLLLARLLAARADVVSGQKRHSEAGELLEEASDLLESVLTKTSSPWVRSRVIGSMDEVFLARLRLEAASGQDASRAFAIVEQARGRTLVDLMLSTPIADMGRSPELRAREREVAALQVQLLSATGRAERQRLLDQIFIAEGQLAPVTSELFRRTRTAPRRPMTLRDVQQALRPDEVLLEFTLTEPDSYCIVATRSSARLLPLPGKGAIEAQVTSLLGAVRNGKNADAEAKVVSTTLLARLPELSRHRRVIVSPDGDLHQLPFELLPGSSGQPLLRSHVVSYTPSGSVLAIVRNRAAQPAFTRAALAVSASPEASVADDAPDATTASVLRDVPRGIYDLDVTKLPSLPSANAEARSVGTTLGADRSTVLIGDAATELALKQQPLQDYRVLHFAVHGVLSTKSPTRSALLLRPAGPEDGLLQAWEVLSFRLRAELVTLSACDTGAGVTHGQEGVSSLVRPFVAAGARTVVANLWAADDRFSLTMMRDFYRRLADGADVAEALRGAKIRMLDMFGPQAVPRLWSGMLVYGDGANTVVASRGGAQTGAR